VSDVKRYRIVTINGTEDFYDKESPTGIYVYYEDYAILERVAAERDAAHDKEHDGK
jgi:hypothetical protein